MDELIREVADKAGITEQQAAIAVATVVDYAKAKLPPALAAQVDSVIAGKTDLRGLGGLRGGFFGSR